MNLYLNYILLKYFVVYFGPSIAFKALRLVGTLGKGFNKPSLRFEKPIFRETMEFLQSCLGIKKSEVERLIRNFLIYESRVFLEHIWLEKDKLYYLPKLINEKTIHKLSNMIQEDGPVILISAHTIYYYLIPWALFRNGIKIAYMTVSPETIKSTCHLLNGSESVKILDEKIPLIFTDRDESVKKGVELIEKGYNLMMCIDTPGYHGRGQLIKLFGKHLWIPRGCYYIKEKTDINILAVFSYVSDIIKPYEIIYSPISTDKEKDLFTQWSEFLEQVIAQYPSSWLGWYYLNEMLEHPGGYE